MAEILIADDSELILKFLSRLLSQESDWHVCGQAANGQQAVLMAHQLKPDAVILDIHMPMMDGLSATVEILKSFPSVPIVLYTMDKSEQLELRAKKIGARKVISKHEPAESLLAGIREVLLAPSTVSNADVLPALMDDDSGPATVRLSEKDSNSGLMDRKVT
jgi:DNA-binding NarL/FixJ family response regulator